MANFLKKVWAFIDGKKMYIVGTGVAIVAFLQFTGAIEDETAKTLHEILTGGGLIALKSALAKLK